MMPPITAVNIPAIGGKPLAEAIPRQRGSAIKKTKNPAHASLNMVSLIGNFMIIIKATTLFSIVR
jgi:hypothetical protein